MSEGPKRIQRRRTKGWRMPENTVYVGRPSLWGNPWTKADTVDRFIDDWRAWCRDAYRRELEHWGLLAEYDLVAPVASNRLRDRMFASEPPMTMHELAREQLRGKDLACWCPLDQPCHADVLLEWANG